MLTQEKNVDGYQVSSRVGHKPGTGKLSLTPDKKLRTPAPLASESYIVKTMPPLLGTWDMTATYLMIIFFITNVTTAVAGGAAAFTYWLLGGITFFIPCYRHRTIRELVSP